VKTVKTRPSLFGITFNDDLADESFSVYDHPKAVICKNVEKLPIEELRERVLHPENYEPLPTLDDILLMDQGGWTKVVVKRDPLPGKVAQTSLVLCMMALSFWALVGSRLKRLPDSGFGLSFIGGLALCAGTTWSLVALDIIPFTRTACVVVFFAISLAAIARLVARSALRRRFFDLLPSQGCFALGSVLAGFVVVLATRNLFPDYFWAGGDLERFYLSFFARNEDLPLGTTVSNRNGVGGLYIGHFIAAWLVKFLGISGAFAYELSFVLLGGVLGGFLYSIIVAVVRKPLFALFFVLVALVPAIRGLHQLYHGYTGVPAAQAEMNMGSPRERLVSWLMVSLKGAPTVIEACDGDQHSQAAMLAGLPTMKLVEGAADGSLAAKQNQALQTACSLQDPQAMFDAMMRLGVEVLLISGEGAVPATRQGAIDALAARPDLFAKLYEQSGSAVFVPAFSQYFPRAYNPKVPSAG
jgi:hypothetical protein